MQAYQRRKANINSDIRRIQANYFIGCHHHSGCHIGSVGGIWDIRHCCWYVKVSSDSTPRSKCSDYLANIKIKGSPAAAFQSAAYGAFTPAGSVFAMLTSLGMLGHLAPPSIAIAGLIALCAFIVGKVYQYNKS